MCLSVAALVQSGCATAPAARVYNVEAFTLCVVPHEYIQEMADAIGADGPVRALWIEASRTMLVPAGRDGWADAGLLWHEMRHLKEIEGKWHPEARE